MKNFKEWQDSQKEHAEPLDLSKPLPKEKANKNSLGGIDPNNNNLKVFKKVDLLTLPENVSGTNCGNCEYVEKLKEGVHFCRHKDVQQYVTDRNCCVYWDHPKAYRKGWEAKD